MRLTPTLLAFTLPQDLTPDYSMESHQQDHENFLVVSRNRRRRAKALLDFERHDDDELGFRKNDIITVSQVSCMLTCSFCFPTKLILSFSPFRSSHRKMNTAGLENSMASEVRLLHYAFVSVLQR